MLYLVCMAFRLCLEQHCECTCYSTSWAVMLHSFNVLGCASRWSDIYGMVVYALLMVVPAKLWWLDDRRSGQDWAIGQEMTAVDCQQISVCRSERDAFNIFRCSALHRLYLIWVHMQNKGITCSGLFSFFLFFSWLDYMLLGVEGFVHAKVNKSCDVTRDCSFTHSAWDGQGLIIFVSRLSFRK